ncbi:hypothetical protein [Spirosoma gilvum]
MRIETTISYGSLPSGSGRENNNGNSPNDSSQKRPDNSSGEIQRGSSPINSKGESSAKVKPENKSVNIGRSDRERSGGITGSFGRERADFNLDKKAKMLNDSIKRNHTEGYNEAYEALANVYDVTKGITESGMEIGERLKVNNYGVNLDNRFFVGLDLLRLSKSIYETDGNYDKVFALSSSMLIGLGIGAIPFAGPILAPFATYAWEAKFAIPTYRWILDHDLINEAL